MHNTLCSKYILNIIWLVDSYFLQDRRCQHLVSLSTTDYARAELSKCKWKNIYDK